MSSDSLPVYLPAGIKTVRGKVNACEVIWLMGVHVLRAVHSHVPAQGLPALVHGCAPRPLAPSQVKHLNPLSILVENFQLSMHGLVVDCSNKSGKRVFARQTEGFRVTKATADSEGHLMKNRITS